MPKTYANSKKEQWLALLAQGKSPKQVAREAGCDERTIKRAVQEMHGRRAAQEAMTQLYEEALRTHMNKLNSALDVIIEGLRLPDLYSAKIAWTQVPLPDALSQHNGETAQEEAKVPGQTGDAFSDSSLLAEHMKNGKAWRALADWKRSYERHRSACAQLQIRAIGVSFEMTALRPRSKGHVIDAPFLHVENTGDLLCRAGIRYLSEKEDTEDLEKEITIDSDRGVVVYRTTVLAEGFKDAGELSKCRENIVKSLGVLKESAEARQVLNTFRQLETALPKARNELLTIRLLGVVPGQCRICRQFGL